MSRHGAFKIFVILSIFLAGALSGAALVRVVSDERDPTAGESEMESFGESEGMESGERDGDEGLRNAPYEFARYLEEELDLTSEQRLRVQEILERRGAEARRMFVESRARFREHLEGTVDEVASALPEDEAEEFLGLVEELERRFGPENDPDGEGERPAEPPG